MLNIFYFIMILCSDILSKMENSDENVPQDRTEINSNHSQSQPGMDYVEHLAEMLVRSMERRQAQIPAPQATPVQRPNVENWDKTTNFDQFLKRKPETFLGGVNPSGADSWLIDMERTFRPLPCTEQQKVIFVADTLKREAHHW